MCINMQLVNIEELNPAKYNPRVDLKLGDEEYEKLKSIFMFKFMQKGR